MLQLPEYLEEALGIQVRRACTYLGKPTCRLRSEVKTREPLERYIVAIGLALDHNRS